MSLAVFAYMVGRKTGLIEGTLAANQGRSSLVPSAGFSISLACLMVSTAFGPGWTQWAFANRAVRKLGDISYGVYLIRWPILLYVVYVLDLPSGSALKSFLVASPIVLPLSLLYGDLSACLLEQPIRRWARQYGRMGGRVEPR